jgi:hypothetical protein
MNSVSQLERISSLTVPPLSPSGVVFAQLKDTVAVQVETGSNLSGSTAISALPQKY